MRTKYGSGRFSVTARNHESDKGVTHESTIAGPRSGPRNCEDLVNKYAPMDKTEKRISQIPSDGSLGAVVALILDTWQCFGEREI